MTYVTEQTGAELRAHMRRLQKMPGWHNPLDDRLFAEVLALDAEIEALRAAALQGRAQEGEPSDERAAFEAAAKSLETIAEGAGRMEFLVDACDVRAYAANRAKAARAALAQESRVSVEIREASHD